MVAQFEIVANIQTIDQIIHDQFEAMESNEFSKLNVKGNKRVTKSKSCGRSTRAKWGKFKQITLKKAANITSKAFNFMLVL